MYKRSKRSFYFIVSLSYYYTFENKKTLSQTILSGGPPVYWSSLDTSKENGHKVSYTFLANIESSGLNQCYPLYSQSEADSYKGYGREFGYSLTRERA